MLIDSTGAGDPVFDEMKREYGNVQGYKLTNPTKKALIENLSIMLDNGEIWFPGTQKLRVQLRFSARAWAFVLS